MARPRWSCPSRDYGPFIQRAERRARGVYPVATRHQFHPLCYTSGELSAEPEHATMDTIRYPTHGVRRDATSELK